MPRQLRVFLCHASQDKPAVRELYKRLKTEDWIDPWLDEEKLSFGQHWTTAIEDALSEADVVLIFLSKNSVQKEGFVQRELNYAWELSLEKPRNVIFLIPFRLDDCQIPRYLGSRQWGDYFGEKKESTYQTLLRSLKQRHQQKLKLEVEESTALKQTEINSIERELRNKWELEQKEKAARENAELLARANLEREAAQKKLIEFREKEEREAKAKVAREKVKHEKTEKGLQGNVKSEATKRTTAEEKINSVPRLDLRLLGVGGIIVIVLILFGLNASLNNPPVGNIVKENTATPNPTKISTETKTSIPLTSTSITVPTIEVTATPVLEIGSTMVSEKDGMTMVYVPRGEFTMGSEDDDPDERPAHKLDLEAYWIDKTEVTNAMYIRCVEEGECKKPADVSPYTNSDYFGNFKFNDFPILYVDWNMAKAYCSWADRRLPTEAEWEKAARGTDGRTYPWGEDISCDRASYYVCFRSPTEVGKYPNSASIYGVLGMAGNAWEWVSSLYKPYPYSADDGRENLSSTEARVLRGGGWRFNVNYVRSADRYGVGPAYSNVSSGFRCALSP